MFSEIETLHSPSGSQIALRRQIASGTARGILLISHGLAEHAGRYDRFASAMAAAGFHVYAHDHRGHGLTTARDAPLGRYAHTDGIAKVISDVKAVRDRAVADHAELPVVLFGHSMGGLIALNAAESDPESYDALAIWNSNFNAGLSGRAAQALLAAERMFKGSDVPSALLPKLTFGAWGRSIEGRQTEFDWLSQDPQEVRKYIDDPLCGFDASVSLWIDLFGLVYQGVRPDRLKRLPADLPVHLVGGDEDPATDKGKAIQWLSETLSKAGLKDVTTTIYPSMRHETLNEIDRDVATQAFAGWCASAIAKGRHEKNGRSI